VQRQCGLNRNASGWHVERSPMRQRPRKEACLLVAHRLNRRDQEAESIEVILRDPQVRAVDGTLGQVCVVLLLQLLPHDLASQGVEKEDSIVYIASGPAAPRKVTDSIVYIASGPAAPRKVTDWRVLSAAWCPSVREKKPVCSSLSRTPSSDLALPDDGFPLKIRVPVKLCRTSSNRWPSGSQLKIQVPVKLCRTSSAVFLAAPASFVFRFSGRPGRLGRIRRLPGRFRFLGSLSGSPGLFGRLPPWTLRRVPCRTRGVRSKI
jgi:hypothetical protein